MPIIRVWMTRPIEHSKIAGARLKLGMGNMKQIIKMIIMLLAFSLLLPIVSSAQANDACFGAGCHSDVGTSYYINNTQYDANSHDLLECIDCHNSSINPLETEHGKFLRLLNGTNLTGPLSFTQYNSNNYQLCYYCHNETQLIGLPPGYSNNLWTHRPTPGYPLSINEPGTNFANELPEGYNFDNYPANIHWDHLDMHGINEGQMWDSNRDGILDSMTGCTACHDPHGNSQGPALTRDDLGIEFGSDVNGEYGIINDLDYLNQSGDVYCYGCHGYNLSFKYYRTAKNLMGDCTSCHAGNMVNMTAFSQGTHVNINTTDGIGVVNNSDCRACHYQTEIDKSIVYTCFNCHLEGAIPTAPQVKSHSSGSASQYVRTSAGITCEFCHGLTSVTGFNEDDQTGVNATHMAIMPDDAANVAGHYLRDLTDKTNDTHNIIDTVGWKANGKNGSQGCLYCHTTASGEIFNATNISKLSSHDAVSTSCYGCHVVGTTTLHDPGVINASQGSRDCLQCHGESGIMPDINVSAFSSSVHAGLNSNATNSTPINNLSKACWACHGNGSDPGTQHPSDPLSATNPANVTFPLDCTEGDCHVNGTPQGSTFDDTIPGTIEHIPAGLNGSTDITTNYNCSASCHVSSLTPHIEPINGTRNETDLSNVSHYGNVSGPEIARVQDAASLNCVLCHKNATNGAVWGNAPQVRHPVNKTDRFCINCHGNVSTLQKLHYQGITTAPEIHTSGFDWEGDGADYKIKSGQQFQNNEGCYACHEENVVMGGTDDANTRICEECHYNNSVGPFSNSINTRTDVNNTIPRVFSHINNSSVTVGVSNMSQYFNSDTNISTPSGCYAYNVGTDAGSCHGVSYSNNSSGYYAFRRLYPQIDGTMKPYRWTQTIDNLPNTSDCRICHLGANATIGTLVDSPYWGYPMNVTSTKPTVFTHTKSEASANSCWGCHVINGAQPVDFHDANITVAGGPDCISCHDAGGPVSIDRQLNVTAMNATSSIHDTLNNATVNGTNYMCYACHLDGQPPASGHPINLSQTKLCDDCHTGVSSFNAPVVGRHIPNASLSQQHSTSNVTTHYAECWDCHNNSVNATGTLWVINKSQISHYGTNSSLVKTNSNDSLPVDQCYNCHNSTIVGSNYGNATQVVMAAQIKCFECHNGDWKFEKRLPFLPSSWVFYASEPLDFHNQSMGTYWACSRCH